MVRRNCALQIIPAVWYLPMKLLTTHYTSRTGYYLCLFMQTEFQLDIASYIHVCTKETHSVVNIQDLIPTLAGLCCL